MSDRVLIALPDGRWLALGADLFESALRAGAEAIAAHALPGVARGEGGAAEPLDQAISDMSSWRRKLLIAIGVTWWIALFGLAFAAYFVTRSCGNGLCDGLGRALTLTPSFVRLLLHTDRLWAGWRWTAIDTVVVWLSAIVVYMLMELLTDDSKPARSIVPVDDHELPPTTFIEQAALAPSLRELQGAIAEAAALATNRSDITLEPEEEGWSIRVNGEVVLQVESSATGRKAIEYARSLIDGRRSIQSVRSAV